MMLLVLPIAGPTLLQFVRGDPNCWMKGEMYMVVMLDDSGTPVLKLWNG
jgi:hypothetical protein